MLTSLLKSPIRVTLSSGDKFYSRSAESPTQELTSVNVNAYVDAYTNRKFKSFDEYHNIMNGIWCTTLERNDYRQSTCTCPTFFKSYIFKHIIGIAAMEKLIKIPSQAKSNRSET